MKKTSKKINNETNRYFKKNKIKIIEKRYNILIIITIICMSILSICLFNVQIIKHAYYQNKVDELTNNIVYGDSTPRGTIYDRNGNILVDNKAIKVIYYKKKSGITLEDEIKTSYTLAGILDIKYNVTDNILKNFWIKNNIDLSNKLITNEENILLSERKITSQDIYNYKIDRTDLNKINYTELDKKAAYIYNLMNIGYSFTRKDIKRENVTDSEYAWVAENLDSLPGIGVKTDWERVYPYGDTFRLILGNVSSSETGIPYEDKDYYLKKGYSLTDRVGITYLEKQYEEVLKGTKNKYKIQNGEYVLIEEGKRGKDIVLSIDINLQQEIEKILEQRILYTKQNEENTEYYDGSFAVISNPNTGEILAMSGKKVIKVNDEYKIYDYTAGITTSPVVIGSAVKGASHIVGYNTGALKIGEIRSDACLQIASTPLKCSWKYLGTLNDVTALKMSSNTYQYHTAINVGQGVYKYNKTLNLNLEAYKTYRDTFAEFGLGIKTEIDLPIESVGYKGKSNLENLLLDFAIGQYDTYTPIQMTQYINTIANNGYRLAPHLLKAIYEPTEQPLTNLYYEYETKILNKVNTLDIYLDRVKEGLKAVMESGGTGSGYISKSYKPAGKTGTSQSIIDTNNDGFVDTMVLNNSFVGYAPYDDPIVTFTVITPNIYHYKGKTTYRSYINMKLSSLISKKFFEIYK